MFATGKKYTPNSAWGEAIVIYESDCTDPLLSNIVDLVSGNYLGCYVTVWSEHFPTTTEDIIVKVQGSLDGITFDTEILLTYTLTKGEGAAQISFNVQGFPYFRLSISLDPNEAAILCTINAYPHK